MERQPLKRRPNMILLLGVVSLVVFALALTVFLAGLRPAEMQALVPKENIPAFRQVTRDMLTSIAIPESKSLQGQVFTSADFTQQKGPVYAVSNLGAGQLIYDNQIDGNQVKSYQIVSPGERVVAVTTTFAGALAGTLQPGNVVDVEGDEGSARDAKVISVGVGSAAGQGVGGVNNPVGASEDSKQIVVMLAVSQGDAPGIAGQEVLMTLNPFCRVEAVKGEQGGEIVAIDPKDEQSCTAS